MNIDKGTVWRDKDGNVVMSAETWDEILERLLFGGTDDDEPLDAA